ncbi:hypothetical protein DFH11DRAFT_1551514 [Phellopilus nigrolimitatus]|nr:hypothetical protein DFH11DRAFT_1551514 [Phellopilus nigrolimitatus]
MPASTQQGLAGIFRLSGSSQQAMAAVAWRHSPPLKPPLVLLSTGLTRSDILDRPSTSPAVKPEVRARLDDVVDSPQPLSLAPPNNSIATDSSRPDWARDGAHPRAGHLCRSGLDTASA